MNFTNLFYIKNNSSNSSDDDIEKNNLEFKTKVQIFDTIFSLISLYLLINSLIINCKKTKRLMQKFLSILIISELFNCIYKLIASLQILIKFEDIIIDSTLCTIQIMFSIFSDFCTLSITLMISLKNWDQLKNIKKKFKDKNIQKWSIRFPIITGIIFSIIFTILDRILSNDDYCIDLCWVSPVNSLILFGFYIIFLIFILFVSIKTIQFLNNRINDIHNADDNNINNNNNQRESKASFTTSEVEEENDEINSKYNNNNNSKYIKDSNSNNNNNEKNELLLNKNGNQIQTVKSKHRYSFLSKKIEKIKSKYILYPLVTISIWFLLASFRVVDDINRLNKLIYSYKDHIYIQILYVIHSVISSLRGCIYTISFMYVQYSNKEKLILYFFYCCHKKFYDNNDENEKNERKKSIIKKIDNIDEDNHINSIGNINNSNSEYVTKDSKGSLGSIEYSESPPIDYLQPSPSLDNSNNNNNNINNNNDNDDEIMNNNNINNNNIINRMESSPQSYKLVEEEDDDRKSNAGGIEDNI